MLSPQGRGTSGIFLSLSVDGRCPALCRRLALPYDRPVRHVTHDSSECLWHRLSSMTRARLRVEAYDGGREGCPSLQTACACLLRGVTALTTTCGSTEAPGCGLRVV